MAEKVSRNLEVLGQRWGGLLMKSCVGLILTLIIAYMLSSLVPVPPPLNIFVGVVFGAFMGSLFYLLID